MKNPILGQYIRINRPDSVYHDRRGFVICKDSLSNGWYRLQLEGEDRTLAFHPDDFEPGDEAELQAKLRAKESQKALEMARAGGAIVGADFKQTISPYHTKVIPRGVYGDSSKIIEEVEEFKDALVQANPILALCELADVIGAIEGYVIKHYNIKLQDVVNMAALNKKAFENGHRL